MKQLKYETKPVVHIVEYNDWDRFIKENFPKCPYDSIVSEEEMNNYSTFSYTTGEMDQKDRIKTKQYLEGENIGKYNYVSTRNILDLLVSYEEIPAGTYNIKIFW